MIEEKQQKSRTRTSVHLSDLAPEGAELFGRDGRKNSENPKMFRVLQDATRQKHVQKSSTTTMCHLLPSWADCSSPEGQEGRQWGGQAVGQAYIPLQQTSSHLGECHTRTTGPVSLLHKEQHQCLCGRSPRGCCDLLISPSRSARGPALAQPSRAVGAGPWPCSGPTLQPPCPRSLPCPGTSQSSTVGEARPRLFPGCCRRQLSPPCPVCAG